MISKTEAKNEAREIIMHALSLSLYHLQDSELNDEDKVEVENAIEIQMNRVAKILGYEKAWFS